MTSTTNTTHTESASARTQRFGLSSAAAASWLRLVLRANAATSLVAGLAASTATDWVVDRLGLDGDSATTWTRAIGIGLIVFAVGVAIVSRQEEHSLRTEAMAVSAVDFAWVVATVIVIGAAGLSGLRETIAILMGVGVLDFAILQLFFARRIAR